MPKTTFNLSTVTSVSTHRTWYTQGIIKKKYCSGNPKLLLKRIKLLGVVKYSGSFLELLSRALNEASLITVYRGCNHHKVPRDCQAFRVLLRPLHMISVGLVLDFINRIENVDMAHNYAIDVIDNHHKQSMVNPEIIWLG